MSPRRETPAAAPASGAAPPRIPVGISACLLGRAVRFDGGHKRNDYVVETLGRAFEWHPVCPEVGIGLGTPRESLRLVAAPGGPRLVAPRSGSDHTEAMRAHAADGLMVALARPASSRRHVDALHHLVGFLRPALSGAERRAILEVIEDYRRGWAPLAAPHALVRHSLRRVEHPWAEAQVYLQPHPKELAAWA